MVTAAPDGSSAIAEVSAWHPARKVAPGSFTEAARTKRSSSSIYEENGSSAPFPAGGKAPIFDGGYPMEPEIADSERVIQTSPSMRAGASKSTKVLKPDFRLGTEGESDSS